MASNAESYADTRHHMSSDLTEGNLVNVIWRMSWPLVVTMLSCATVDLIHVHIAGMLSASSQAAVGLVDQMMMIAVLIATAIGSGTTAVVARAIGAGDRNGAVLATSQALRVAAVVGALLSVGAFAAGKLLLPQYCSSPEVLTEAAAYLSVITWYLVPFAIVCSINAAIRGLGSTTLQLQVVLLMMVTDVVLNYGLVSFVWPTARTGLAGIAIVAIVSSTAGLLLALYKLNRSPLAGSISNLDKLCWYQTKRILRIGLPCALLELTRVTSTFVLFFILSHCRQPQEAVASWALGMRLEAFLFLPLDALALGAAAIVVQNLGAMRIDRAWSASWTIAGLGLGLMVVASALMFSLAEPIARLGSSDANVITYTTDYLRLNAVCEPFLALEVILGAILQSMGDSRVPMSIGILSNWIVRLPVAALLGLSAGLGPAGVWLAMTVSNILAGLLMLTRFCSNDTWTMLSSSRAWTNHPAASIARTGLVGHRRAQRRLSLCP